jgi:hypothetical protein
MRRTYAAASLIDILVTKFAEEPFSSAQSPFWVIIGSQLRYL